MKRLEYTLLSRKVDVRLPRKGNSNSHGARPVHLIITMLKWIRTSRLSIKNSLSLQRFRGGLAFKAHRLCVWQILDVKMKRLEYTLLTAPSEDGKPGGAGLIGKLRQVNPTPYTLHPKP